MFATGINATSVSPICQTMQWQKEEGQTMQWPKEEGQTMQWPKEI
jgi:hypothetical protein